jgi:hypothetical protein
MATERGLAGLAFADPGAEEATLAEMKARWPKATYVADAAQTGPIARRIFDPTLWQAEQPLRVVLIGTDWEVRVWQALLKIPMGRLATYSGIAGKVRSPGPRAPSAPLSARTQSPLSCPAIASSAKPASSPAITGASPASAPCSAGRPERWPPRRDRISFVVAGLDPATHVAARHRRGVGMDPRVKPAGDDQINRQAAKSFFSATVASALSR